MCTVFVIQHRRIQRLTVPKDFPQTISFLASDGKTQCTATIDSNYMVHFACGKEFPATLNGNMGAIYGHEVKRIHRQTPQVATVYLRQGYPRANLFLVDPKNEVKEIQFEVEETKKHIKIERCLNNFNVHLRMLQIGSAFANETL